jgi:hypothetical protein
MDTLLAPIGHQSPATEINWPVTVMAGTELIEVKTKDISATGVSISYHKPLQSDVVLRMFIMPPNQQTVVVSGELEWWHPRGIDDKSETREEVLSFVKIHPHDQQLLDELISAHLG